MQLISRILTILWKSLEIVEIHVWMTNSGKLFADELTECLIEEGFVKSQFQMSIYYKYALEGSKIVVLS